MIISNSGTTDKFQPGETIYARGTAVSFVVSRVKWFEGTPGAPKWSQWQGGWRYELTCCPGLFQPEWTFSPNPDQLK
jgi:hypothetical protein